MKCDYCDNTDCPNLSKQTLYLTVLHEDFDYDICWWCEDCLIRDGKMVYMSELDIIELRIKLSELQKIFGG